MQQTMFLLKVKILEISEQAKLKVKGEYDQKIPTSHTAD